MATDKETQEAPVGTVTRYTIEEQGNGSFKLVVDKKGAWMQAAEVETRLQLSANECAALDRVAKNCTLLLIEKDAEVRAHASALAQAEATSEGRRKTLLNVADELRLEWIARENAEAELAQCREERDALRGELGQVRVNGNAADGQLSELIHGLKHLFPSVGIPSDSLPLAWDVLQRVTKEANAIQAERDALKAANEHCEQRLNDLAQKHARQAISIGQRQQQAYELNTEADRLRTVIEGHRAWLQGHYNTLDFPFVDQAREAFRVGLADLKSRLEAK